MLSLDSETRLYLGCSALSLSEAAKPRGEYTTNSITHGQCDAKPTVTLPVTGLILPPTGQNRMILLGDRGTECEQFARSLI